MKNPTDFAYHLTRYFNVFLMDSRNLSRNTISAYSHTFRLLMQFFEEQRSIPVTKLSLKQIDKQAICDFLNWLQKDRSCSDSILNSRLTAIHSFYHYLQSEIPECIYTSQTIMNIPYRKKDSTVLNYLSKEQVERLLLEPDLQITRERRDAVLLCVLYDTGASQPEFQRTICKVLLCVLYDTGARVQELCDLKIRNFNNGLSANITLRGKGRKSRVVPIVENTTILLTNYIRENKLNMPEKQDYPLFFNQHKEALSRSGITHILKKYTSRIKDMPMPASISPHILRHSKAMHLLQAGYNMIVIRDWLGHVSVKTTEIYARLDVNAKRAILEKAFPIKEKIEYPDWSKDKNLMDFLKNL